MRSIVTTLYAGIDYNFRPDSYWTACTSTPKAMLRNMKGRRRSEMVRDLYAAGKLEGLSDKLLSDSLGDGTRNRLSQIHPTFMGGEYLPDYGRHETEMGRVALESMTYDVISLRARPAGSRIAHLSHSQNARLAYHEPCIPPPAPVLSKWARLRAFVGSMAGDLKSVFRVTSILTLALAIIFGIHTGASWVDATLRTGVHPQSEATGEPEDNDLRDREIVQLPDGQDVLGQYLGFLPGEEYLPREDNHIGGLYWAITPTPIRYSKGRRSKGTQFRFRLDTTIDDLWGGQLSETEPGTGPTGSGLSRLAVRCHGGSIRKVPYAITNLETPLFAAVAADKFLHEFRHRLDRSSQPRLVKLWQTRTHRDSFDLAGCLC